MSAYLYLQKTVSLNHGHCYLFGSQKRDIGETVEDSVGS